MKRKIYYIDLIYRQQSKSFVMKDNSFIIGNTERSNFFIADKIQEEKIELSIRGSDLIIKINNPSYAVKSSDKLFTQVKIKNNSTLQCGPVLFKIESRVEDDEIEFSDELVIGDDFILPPPPIPSSIQVEKNTVQDKKSEINDLKIPSPVLSKTSYSQSTFDGNTKNYEIFNTTFDDQGVVLNSIPYEDNNIYFKGYIELYDEVQGPKSDLLIESLDKLSVHIVHAHNGTTLNDQYFPFDIKKIYLANTGHKKNTFAAHDCETKKSNLISIVNNQIHVFEQNGYEFLRSNKNNQISSITTTGHLLSENEKIIFSKGLSQIIVEIKKQPPIIKKDFWPSIDDKIIKCLMGSWVAFFVPMLLILLLTDNPVITKIEQTKEVAIIYRRVEPKIIPEVKVKEVEEIKKVEEAKEPEVIVQAEPSKPEANEVKVIQTKAKDIKQKNLAAPIAPRAVQNAPKEEVQKLTNAAPTVSPKDAQIKQVEETYTFTALSQITKEAGRINGTVKSATNTASVKLDHLVTGHDNSISQSNSKLVGAGSISNQITDNQSDIEGVGTGAGNEKSTTGLSRKTSSMTSYRESNVRVLGSIDPELIKKILREYIPQFRYCYQKELMTNPSIAGVFDLNFTINSKGKGQDVFLKQNKGTFSEKTVSCISQVVAIINFPIPKGDSSVEVRQPLNFSSN